MALILESYLNVNKSPWVQLERREKLLSALITAIYSRFDGDMELFK